MHPGDLIPRSKREWDGVTAPRYFRQATLHTGLGNTRGRRWGVEPADSFGQSVSNERISHEGIEGLHLG